VDFDDLCDETAYTLQVLEALREANPGFKATLFTIPARTSSELIVEAKKHEWLALAPHGWRHTRGECLAWTKEEALAKIEAAREKGIDAPAFRAPAWLLDRAVYDTCMELDYTVCDHAVYRIPIEGAKTYTYNLLGGRAPQVRAIHGHLTRTQHVDNWILRLIQQGRLRFAPKSEFFFPWEVAITTTAASSEMAL
jgi:predicted deacetylase